MGVININAAAVLFVAAVYYQCVMTNGQNCATERNRIASDQPGVNCSLTLSRVVDYVISRQSGFSILSDLDSACATSTNNTFCQRGIMDYFTACRSIETVRLYSYIAIIRGIASYSTLAIGK